MLSTKDGRRKYILLGLLGFAASIYLIMAIFIRKTYILSKPQRRLHSTDYIDDQNEFLTDGCQNFTLLEGLHIPNVSSYPTNLTIIKDIFPDLVNGSWSPEACDPGQKIALIIPYRNRSEQLPLFLYHMHTFLRKQMKDYQIFLIEQSDSESFNRATLFNIGYEQALKMDNFACFIFHDVDLLPENDKLAYTCRKGVARHFAELISSMNYTRIYKECAGGVIAFHSDDFLQINGFSNSYWGWGAEDDDLYKRIKENKLKFEHQEDKQGRYTALRHLHKDENKKRFQILNGWKKRFKKDGLNSLLYKIVNREVDNLFVKISVDLRDLRKLVKQKWNV